jgi:methionyl-tRNA synthetase
VETIQEAQRSHLVLTYDPGPAGANWQREEIPAGRQLPQPEPLFKKLDDSVADDELTRLRADAGR